MFDLPAALVLRNGRDRRIRGRSGCRGACGFSRYAGGVSIWTRSRKRIGLVNAAGVDLTRTIAVDVLVAHRENHEAELMRPPRI